MSIFFFFNDTATTEIYTLSLHDALPISSVVPTGCVSVFPAVGVAASVTVAPRSEEHTSELQSQSNLVCRLLLEKKKTLLRLCRCLHQVVRLAGSTTPHSDICSRTSYTSP